MRLYFNLLLLILFVFFSCKKKDRLPSLPAVTTNTPSEFAASTAIVGGNITSDGGALVKAAGICYGTTDMPTIANDTANTAALTGAFTVQLRDLASNTTYYVRAYATNVSGTGYGEVKSFTTGNEAPTVTNVTIEGVIEAAKKVTVSYEYQDKENDLESGTTFQWYRSETASGDNVLPIEGATDTAYLISDEDQGKFIWVGVTPKTTTGSLVGVEAVSDKKGPVGEATSITFMYNNVEVTYGIITSATTNKRWLDRNLGAPNVPNTYNDYANYGDLFQWGRNQDGHQLITRAADPGDAHSGTSTPVNGYSTAVSDNDAPGHNKFIQPQSDPYDWRLPQNDNLWQGATGTNNPCPAGWRIPTLDEWGAEQFGASSEDNFTKLKITLSGKRYGNGVFAGVGTGGYYWSSTILSTKARAISLIDGYEDNPLLGADFRSSAYAIRCIKN